MTMPADPFTSERRMCDDAGMTTGKYLFLLNYLRRLTYIGQGRLHEFKPTTEPLMCTGHAHLAGEHIRCTSPVHLRPPPDVVHDPRDIKLDSIRQAVQDARRAAEAYENFGPGVFKAQFISISFLDAIERILDQ